MLRNFTLNNMILWGMLGLLLSCSVFRGAVPKFEAQPAKTSDRVEAKNDAALTVFDIFSPGGIGGAEIHLASGKLPRKMLLRLYLKGLEEFRFSAGGDTILVSVSSSGENLVRQSLRMKNGENREWQGIDSSSPYWMKLRIVPANNEDRKIPLEDGYFEIEAPEYFLKKEISGFSLSWIDFYRE